MAASSCASLWRPCTTFMLGAPDCAPASCEDDISLPTLHFTGCTYVLSCFSPVWFFETQWAIAHQAPLSVGFSRQEHWSGLPCPPLGGLPDSQVEPSSLKFPALAGRLFTTSTTRRRRWWHPTPVLLPGNSHGRRSLEGCSPWGRWGSDTTERLHFHFHALEKEMATPSSVLAWRIPGTGEPGGLPSLGSHRVGHNWSSLAAAAAAAHKLLGAGQDASVLSHDYCPPSPPALILWILVMCHSVLSPFKAYGYRYVCFCGYNFFP